MFKPLKWTWGLIPLGLVIALVLAELRDQVEDKLSSQSAELFRTKGYSWAYARFDGRDAVLEGITFSAKERDAALAALSGLWGVRKVVDKSTLIASPETYTWYATIKEKRVQIRGHVPTEGDRRAILGFVKASMPDFEVDDKMALAGGAPPKETWLGAVSFALLQLGHLRNGRVNLDGTELTVQGVAHTTESYKAVNDSLNQNLPKGTQLKLKDVAPPVVQPFDWRVKYTGSTIALGGYVPNDTDHDLILQRTRNLFPGVKIEDSMQLASGAPPAWLWAVTATLTQLHRLESGRIKLKDKVVEFEGIAGNEYTAKDVVASIRNGLPSSFRSSEKVTIKAEKPSLN